MSEMKHTPGPWTVRTLENFGFNVVHYINGDKFDISRVAKCHDEANARFIASAPELLEHLKRRCSDLRAALDCKAWTWDEDQRYAAELEYAESMELIAKAEGRT